MVSVLLPIDLCADAAIQVWDQEAAAIMVAIAGPESGYNQYANGDPPSAFPESTRPEYDRWACQGFTSFGLWQINLRWNHPTVSALSGYTQPCDLAAWLYVRQHNARAARAVWESQGYAAWSAYNVNAHLSYIERARAAVIAALMRVGVVPEPPLVIPFPTPVRAPFDFAAFEALAPVEPPPAAVEPPVDAVEPPSL